MKQVKKIISKCVLYILILSIAIIGIPTNVYAINKSDVSRQLDSLITQYEGTTWNQSFAGGTQCYAFAHYIFNTIFGRGNAQVGNGALSSNSTCYKLNNVASDINVIGILEPGYSLDSLKNLFKEAEPGDYIQVKRNSSGGPHSMIVADVGSDTISIFDANSDGKGTVKHYQQSYSTFQSMNAGVSIYRHSSYEVSDNESLDLGTDFYAYIINTHAWKTLANDGPNVSMRSETDEAKRVWKFDRQSDGSYKITSCADGLVLDVHNAGTTDGTNVAVAASNDSTAQRWFISGESGAYYLRAACGNLVLDINGASTEEGANAQMWTKNDSTAQKFQIWKLNKAGSTYAHCAAGTTYVPTIIWWDAASDTTRYDIKIWKGTVWEGDAYKIIWGETDTSCEVNLPAGYYEAYVDCCNDYSASMSNVIQFTVEEGTPVDLGDDFYASLLINESWLNVANVDSNAQLAQNVCIASKIWNFQKQDDGSYVIVNCADGKVLDVYNAENENGTNVQVYERNNGDNQKWYIYGRWSGEYYLKPKCSNKVLDITGGNNNIGDNVQIHDLNYSVAQKFAIYQVDDLSILENVEEHTYISEIIKEATCQEEGTIKYTCSACQRYYTEPIEMASHQYSNEWTIDVEATFTSEGSKSRHCLNCDAKTDITVIPKLEQVVEGGIFSLTNASGTVGQTVDVYINMAENPGIVGATLAVEYDTNKLQLISCEDLGVLNDYQFSALDRNPFLLNWEDPLADENNMANGNIAKLQFKILKDLGEEGAELQLSVDTAYDVNVEDVEFSTINGKITMKSYTSGDVNEDGTINSKDSLLLRKYILGENVTINLNAADVNRDGVLNSKDSIILRKYILGDNVELR